MRPELKLISVIVRLSVVCWKQSSHSICERRLTEGLEDSPLKRTALTDGSTDGFDVDYNLQYMSTR